MGPSDNGRGYPILAALVIASILLVTIYYKEGRSGPLHTIQTWAIGVVAPVQSTARVAIRPLSSAYNFFIDLGTFRDQNAALKRENVDLKGKTRLLSSTQAENKRLKKLLGYEKETGNKGVLAKVIGWQSNNWQSAIVIDAGLNDGVKKGMPVVVGEGLVGQVVQASASASRVLLVIDQKSGVSVQLSGSGDVGVLQGQSDGSLAATYISKDTTVTAGESVTTSGLGGVFPKGLLVGKTVGKGKVGYNLFKTVRVTSAVDFLKLDEVLVVTNVPDRAPFGE